MRVSNATVRRRLLAAGLICAVMFICLIIRLAYVQLVIGPEIAAKAEDSWRRNVPFTAKRGEIVDRNGIALAYNISTPTVWAIPAQIQDAEGTARKLAEVLGMTEEKVYQILTKRSSIERLQPGGRKITLDKAREVQQLGLAGIIVGEDNDRYYPFDNLASHVLGFTGIDNQGLAGIELKYDEYLSGIQGSIAYLADAAGRQLPNSSEQYIPPKDGLTLQLTLDKHIQAFMEREFDQAMLQHQPKSIIGIAMDPNTGEILAMASRPDYEPANYQQYPSEVYNRNLPIWMTYEPGSTFKIITLAAALEEGKIDLRHDSFFDPGWIEVSGAHLRCWKRGGHGSQTFLEVVQNSCNPGFVVLGQMLGKEVLFDYIKKFGFGTKTGIDLLGEENGILFNLERVGPVELATTSFGQGVSVTPIQQVAAVAAAVNGGKLYKPYVAKAWIDPKSGEVIEEREPELVRQVISEETSKLVREALESVVALGTGRNAFIDGYRVGGKTGTAQKVIDGVYSKDEHIVSFIAAAPADDPQVVIYVAVDDPQGIQFGGLVAAPIVRNIMEDTLVYLGIEPRQEQINKAYQYPDTPIVEVPNLVGLTTTEIYEMLRSDLQIVTSGKGRVIVNQAPKAGTRVEQGSVIRIYLSDASQNQDHDHNHHQ